MIDFPTSKRCPACGETKRAGDFYIRQNEPCRLSGRCKQCSRRQAKTWAAANPEARRVITGRYVKTPATKAKQAAVMRARYAAGLRSVPPEKAREIKARWQREHPEQHRQRQSRRRARRRGAFVEDVHPQVVFESHGGCCGVCGELIEGDYHIDHVIPLARGGEHSYANSQPAHPLCNIKKGVS